MASGTTIKRLWTIGREMSAKHTGASRRRGRNASNMWFARILAAIVAPKQKPIAEIAKAHPRRTRCATCGREMQACKARNPKKQQTYVSQ